MKKPTSLRAALTAALPDLAANPEKLHIFVDEGRVIATGGKTLSFEYQYTVTLIVVDFSGSADAITVPVLAWLRVNQPELFFSPDHRHDGFKFEADILNHSTVDLQIKLPLTERVTVTVDGPSYRIVHHDEPVDENDDPTSWRPTTA